MKNSVTNTIHLNDADAGEIYSIIKNFKNKSTRDTKKNSLRQGIFPDELKIASHTDLKYTINKFLWF